jgi:hypothetical protein
MIHFLNITLQAKDPACDWRAFLDWADTDNMTVYQLRGYGTDPGAAAADAWNKFNGDRNAYIEGKWDWI